MYCTPCIIVNDVIEKVSLPQSEQKNIKSVITGIIMRIIAIPKTPLFVGLICCKNILKSFHIYFALSGSTCNSSHGVVPSFSLLKIKSLADKITISAVV